MQITLKQRDIELALRMYLSSQGIALAGRSFDVEFTAGRKDSGLSACIDIGAAEELAQAYVEAVIPTEPPPVAQKAMPETTDEAPKTLVATNPFNGTRVSFAAEMTQEAPQRPERTERPAVVPPIPVFKDPFIQAQEDAAVADPVEPKDDDDLPEQPSPESQDEDAVEVAQVQSSPTTEAPKPAANTAPTRINLFG